MRVCGLVIRGTRFSGVPVDGLSIPSGDTVSRTTVIRLFGQDSTSLNEWTYG